MDGLEKLFYLGGIAREYHDFSGAHRWISHEARQACARAMGLSTDTPAAIDAAVYALDAKPWTIPLCALQVVDVGDHASFELRLPDSKRNTSVHWSLATEQGERSLGNVIPATLREIGEYYIDGVRFAAYAVPLGPLCSGYHQLQLTIADEVVEGAIAACPASCFQPRLRSSLNDSGQAHSRYWGVSCQLYTLRSNNNWGIGDFLDLRVMLGHCAAVGMDYVLLNPLHAPNFAGEDFSSPYSASDRRFINPLYIDIVGAAEDLKASSLQKEFQATAAGEEVALLRVAPLIAHAAVAKRKLTALHTLYRWFVSEHKLRETACAKRLNQFVQQQGSSLQDFAAHAAANPLPDLGFASDEHFEIFLQWLAHEQLQSCQALATELGMSIGLIGDLAVGASGGGAEVCSNAELFCRGVSVGAPPDAFNQHGQNWALPAPKPLQMQSSAFAHFIALLRANMRSVGGLRIDHAMGLMRLWWCLDEMAEGAYVYYPFETLFALLRLESHRAQCCVIGEDMGVVEDAFRQAMTDSEMFNNRLFYFERDYDGRFRNPDEHSEATFFMLSSHDTPTLAAWWSGADLRLNADLGLSENTEQQLGAALQERAHDREQLIEWLTSNDALPDAWRVGGECLRNLEELHAQPFDFSLCAALHLVCARSRSRLLSIQLEDLQLMDEPVNVPGTYREYPNWRRKQKKASDDIFADPKITHLFELMKKERHQ